MDQDPSDFAEERRILIETIATEARETAGWTGRPSFSPRVMTALRDVPRHLFVPAGDRDYAYVNRPLAIGHGQTISQPFIVAVMSDLLDLEANDRVLEVGTGCGYQTAVLAQLARHVYSIEVVAELAEDAARRLQSLGCANASLRHGDGYVGWPEEAPFDAVIVTAAPPHLPQSLIDQLRPGGRLVAPLGPAHDTQMLCRCVKADDGALVREDKLPVAFVPMVAAGPGHRLR